MVGQPTATKPSRSDEVLDADLQLRITNQVRAQFESLAPKRPIKPNRSESDSSTSPPTSCLPDEGDFHVPELHKLKSLQAQSQGNILASNPEVVEEFVETEYYKELGCIDKQHHTTGSGFIKVAAGNEDYDLKLAGGGALENRETVFKTNPATNDWIPSSETYQAAYISSKPSRSESS